MPQLAGKWYVSLWKFVKRNPTAYNTARLIILSTGKSKGTVYIHGTKYDFMVTDKDAVVRSKHIYVITDSIDPCDITHKKRNACKWCGHLLKKDKISFGWCNEKCKRHWEIYQKHSSNTTDMAFAKIPSFMKDDRRTGVDKSISFADL